MQRLDQLVKSMYLTLASLMLQIIDPAFPRLELGFPSQSRSFHGSCPYRGRLSCRAHHGSGIPAQSHFRSIGMHAQSSICSSILVSHAEAAAMFHIRN